MVYGYKQCLSTELTEKLCIEAVRYAQRWTISSLTIIMASESHTPDIETFSEPDTKPDTELDVEALQLS